MVGSRLERIGTIYSRISGLLRSQALKPENKPIWYEIYQNFPPKYPPKFDRPIPNVEITQLFYPEDILRARISKEKSAVVGSVNLQDNSHLSNSQKCIAYYEELKGECENDNEAFEKAVERVVSEIPMKKGGTPQVSSIADEFKRSKNINLANVFKEQK